MILKLRLAYKCVVSHLKWQRDKKVTWGISNKLNSVQYLNNCATMLRNVQWVEKCVGALESWRVYKCVVSQRYVQCDEKMRRGAYKYTNYCAVEL